MDPSVAEQVLADGGVTHVVRVGDTVRRPVRPFTATAQAFLAHLHESGFHDAPRPLGYDDQGREVLSYLAGDVPTEPLPEWATTDAVLVGLAQMIRRLHDAAQGWAPPEDAVFGNLPGTPPPGIRPLFTVPELVSHQDYCPGNVVFGDGLPTGLIDFDLARPTTRVADLVNALYWWIPLMDPVDRAPSLVDADAGARMRLFADAYGLDDSRRRRIVPTALRRAANSTLTMRAAAEADPVFLRWWEEGVKERMPRVETWTRSNADRLNTALLG